MNNLTIRPYGGTLIGVPWVCAHQNLATEYDLSDLYPTAVTLLIIPELQNELSLMGAVLDRDYTTTVIRSPAEVLDYAFRAHVLFNGSAGLLRSIPRATPLPLLQWAVEQTFTQWINDGKDVAFPVFSNSLRTADLLMTFHKMRNSKVCEEDVDFCQWFKWKVREKNELITDDI